MYANEFKTMEKQILPEKQKLTATCPFLWGHSVILQMHYSGAIQYFQMPKVGL